MHLRLPDLAPPQRLAIGLFLVLFLGFYLLSQVKIVTSLAGGGPLGYPGPDEILVKYHGDRGTSRFHRVLDPALPAEEPKAMYGYLGISDEERAANRAKVLSWVERGSPREDWPAVAVVFTGELTCGQCHNASKTDVEGRPLPKADLPFETYEQVLAASGADTGMSVHDLATSSHNHMWGFAAASLILSLLFSLTRWRGAGRTALVVGAFAGPAIDVACWWLTRDHGHPYEWGVLVGGGLFGASTVAMALLTLDELWLRGGVGTVAETALRWVGFRPREPARPPEPFSGVRE